MRRGAKGPRIVIAPIEVAGVAQGLLEGFALLGVTAQAALCAPHPFGYQLRVDSTILGIWRSIGAWRLRIEQRSLPLRAVAKGAQHLWGWVSLFSVLNRTDCFVFLFAKTFTDTRAELLLLRSLRKKIVFIYLGSDARPPYIDRITHVSESAPDLLSLRKRTRRQSRRIRTQERFATHCINLPGTGHFHRRPFVNWFELGLPRTVAGSGVRSEPRPGRAVRILHSPSDRRVKGTDAIAAAVESLRLKGYELDLVTVTDAPNSVVKHELSACDLVVDQLYSDSPMAAFATEAAHFAKPVLVGGYAARNVEHLVGGVQLPTLFVHPDDLNDALEGLITHPDRRRALGIQAQRFVLDHWAPVDVARRLLRIINDDFPRRWLVSPSTLRYVHGCGGSEELTRRQVAALVDAFGPEALCVSDKPHLERSFLDFARDAEAREA